MDFMNCFFCSGVGETDMVQGGTLVIEPVPLGIPGIRAGIRGANRFGRVGSDGGAIGGTFC
ncbi:MAG: hypothetical protein ACSLEZ_02245, partial [Thiobacillus sp.]